ncbi:hypothetical protein DFP73DRAFT_538167, partial [Morchella snyderi]
MYCGASGVCRRVSFLSILPFTCGRRFPIRSATYLCPSTCPRSLSNQTKRMYQTPMSQGRDREYGENIAVERRKSAVVVEGGPSIGTCIWHILYMYHVLACTCLVLLVYLDTCTYSTYVAVPQEYIHIGTIHYCRETCKYGERELGYIYMGLVNVCPPPPPVLQGTSSTCLPETRNKI